MPRERRRARRSGGEDPGPGEGERREAYAQGTGPVRRFVTAQIGFYRATETGTRYAGDPVFEGRGERYPGILGGYVG